MFVSAVVAAMACRGAPNSAAPARSPISPATDAATTILDSAVSIVSVAPGLWMHVTRDPASGFPSNGLVLETGDESVLFDTAWDDRETAVILGWAANRLHKPVRRAIITHAHNDRLGGLGALRRAGIPASALAATVTRATTDGVIAAAAARPTPGGGADPVVPLDSIPGLTRAAHRDRAGFELFFPGVGHAPDNIVVYFAAQRVLFGGCLVKADTATTVGNVADADVAEWPRTVARVAARFGDARIVIPGHGAVSGRSALAVTESLITAKGPAAAEAYRRQQNKQD